MPMSATAIRESLKQRGTQAWIVLMTVTHSSFTEPMRLSDSSGAVVSRGNTYSSLIPFQIVFPDADSEQAGAAKIKFDNVERDIYEAIWGLQESPICDFEVVLSDTPDVVELSAKGLKLANAEADELYITADLKAADRSREPYPGHSFTPINAPGLF